MERTLKNLGLAVAALALALAASEALLRVRLGAPPRWRFPQEAYLPDPEMGFQLAPEQQAFTHDEPVRINSLGLRDEEYPAVAPAGVRRLVALGDSQTFGNGLALEDTWPKRLEAHLDAESDALRWEVVNAGIPGSDTWQHEIVLARLRKSYEFDGVVLAVYVNDVVPRPARVGVSVAQSTNTWSKRIGYLLKSSALFVAVWQLRHSIAAWSSGAHGSWEDRVLSDEAPTRAEAGWRQLESSLAAMRALSSVSGFDFRIVVLPRRDQVTGVWRSRSYQDRIAEIAARLEAPCLDALPVLQRGYAERGDRLFLAWDGHNSGVANDLIARAMAPWILASEHLAEPFSGDRRATTPERGEAARFRPEPEARNEGVDPSTFELASRRGPGAT